jgi:hypothetical protein
MPSSLADRCTRLCPASSATGSAGYKRPARTANAQFGKLLFGALPNYDDIVGDGFPVPVILEQNHISVRKLSGV